MFKNFMLGCMAVVLGSAVIYGTYWISKNLSYVIFYENLVQGTICEMVKPEHLVRECN